MAPFNAICQSVENTRLMKLSEYNILNTEREKEFDDITKIASSIFKVPFSLLTFIGLEKGWVKSSFGSNLTLIPRNQLLCSYAIQFPNEFLVIDDLKTDIRFFDTEMATANDDIVFYTGIPITTDNNECLGALCVFDTKPRNKVTSEEKELLQALANQVMFHLNFRKKCNTLTEKNNQILQLNTQLNDFAHRIAHDLKTPLRGISSLIDFLNEDIKQYNNLDEVDGLFSIIFDKISYMESLINGILDYTKSINKEEVFEEFNFKFIIEDLLGNLFFEKKVAINYIDCDVTIFSSKIAIVQIFLNLISNSLKFNDKEHCLLELRLVEESKFYKIIYEDNGPGIPFDYRKKVFNMFETLGKTGNENTGIGLATVNSIIKKLKGSIIITGRKNNQEGVCFQVIIPKKII